MGWSEAQRLNLLQLVRSRGIGAGQYDRLLDNERTPEDAIAMALDLGGPKFQLASRSQIEREWAATLDRGCSFVFKGELAYPRQLAQIDQAPCVLTVWGDPAVLMVPTVGMVGARNASGGGIKMAGELAAGIAASGRVVASGLARGIDTAAHRGALQTGRTVAVIASGIDIVYPPENRDLGQQIAERGAVVTERPFGAPPHARQFPRRNRIIAGLSQGVLVVEAALRSGSLITARFALDQGRDVMAVPGSPLDARHRGTNQLLREGAHLVESTADVFAALAPFAASPGPGEIAKTFITEQHILPLAAKPDAAHQRSPVRETKARPTAKPTDPPKNAGTVSVLDELRQRLAAAPLDVDELIRQCHATPAEVLRGLAELELTGEVERYPGNRVARQTS